MYWSPTGDRAADAKLERQQHLRQRTTLAVEQDSGPDAHDAQAERFGVLRFALPDDADVGEEVVARGSVLVEALVAVRAVVADRAGADQRGRPRVRLFDGVDEAASSLLA